MCGFFSVLPFGLSSSFALSDQDLTETTVREGGKESWMEGTVRGGKRRRIVKSKGDREEWRHGASATSDYLSINLCLCLWDLMLLISSVRSWNGWNAIAQSWNGVCFGLLRFPLCACVSEHVLAAFLCFVCRLHCGQPC